MNKQCRRRLQKEFINLKKEPVPNIEAVPKETNIREWHYILYGPKETAYEGGVYHGKLVFPTDYPYKPPSIYMITPSGRFITNTRICLSISDFHPETWNPLWSVGSILTGLLSFMMSEDMTTGAMKLSNRTRKALAVESMQTNMKNEIFCELFPEVLKNYNSPVSKTPKVVEKQKEVLGKSKLFFISIGLLLAVGVGMFSIN